MRWLDRLERKYGRYAVKHLMSYIVALNAAAFLLIYLDGGGAFYEALLFKPALVLQGQLWRLITFVFIPPTLSLLWSIFVLYFYYMIGGGLEQEWGSFKFNLYYLVGVLATVAVGFATGVSASPVYLNLSLFLAFASLYPDFQVMIFFILPLKIKYLAWLDWAFLGFTVLTAPWPIKCSVVAALANYFLFFGRDFSNQFKLKRQVHRNRQRFFAELERTKPMHKCTICGKTEASDPKMDFRYCNDCAGDYEYCMDHLRAHAHIQAGS